MVVAVRRFIRFESPASVRRFKIVYIQHINDFCILWIGINAGVVPGALPHVPVAVEFGPGFSTVVGTQHAALFRFDNGPYPFRIGRRHRNPDDAQRPFWYPFIGRKVGPGIAAVCTFPDGRAFAAAL